MTGEYPTCLLRMWRASGDSKPWRALLDDVETSAEHRFASLQSMSGEEDCLG